MWAVTSAAFSDMSRVVVWEDCCQGCFRHFKRVGANGLTRSSIVRLGSVHDTPFDRSQWVPFLIVAIIQFRVQEKMIAVVAAHSSRDLLGEGSWVRFCCFYIPQIHTRCIGDFPTVWFRSDGENWIFLDSPYKASW